MAERNHAPSLDRGFAWLNTDRPLDFGADLKGHVVLLDFWTYCCINCMHVLPDLAYLEEKYADAPLVVIGVHSNKFTNEGVRRNVRSAVLRYDIAHPVVVDEDMAIWRSFGVNSWPTRVLVDPEGYVVGGAPGEGMRREFDERIGKLLADHGRQGTLANGPLALRREEVVPTASGLRFPGKVLADEAGGRLFITDSNHHRIVVTTWPDETGACDLIRVIGSGAVGCDDGPVDTATFDHPQGTALHDGALYVADTENHAIRRIALDGWTVSTVAGTGEMSNDRQGGERGTAQGLNSPWDLEAHGELLYIAMAGTHQLWFHEFETGVTAVFAGSGIENITDGPAAQAALAQPSGLARAGDVLYFADSETSAIRGVDLRTRAVFTVIGTGLFDFGDVDGAYPHARLQHALGVAVWGDGLLVADTYNHKLRLVHPASQEMESFAGLGVPATQGERGGLGLYEPGGVSVAGDVAFIADTNHHRIVRVDLQTKAWAPLHIAGLTRPRAETEDTAIAAAPVTISANAAVTLTLAPAIPDGASLNADAPVSLRVTGADGTVLLDEMHAADDLPVEAVLEDPGPGGDWHVELHMGYCTDGDTGMCIPHSVRWRVPVEAAPDGASVVALAE